LVMVGRAVEMTDMSRAERMDVMLSAANMAQNRQPCCGSCGSCASTAAVAMLVVIPRGEDTKTLHQGKGACPVPYSYSRTKSCVVVRATAREKAGGY
jgi:hypothetical protein